LAGGGWVCKGHAGFPIDQRHRRGSLVKGARAVGRGVCAGSGHKVAGACANIRGGHCRAVLGAQEIGLRRCRFGLRVRAGGWLGFCLKAPLALFKGGGRRRRYAVTDRWACRVPKSRKLTKAHPIRPGKCQVDKQRGGDTGKRPPCRLQLLPGKREVARRISAVRLPHFFEL
jgi:hypothetical protein